MSNRQDCCGVWLFSTSPSAGILVNFPAHAPEEWAAMKKFIAMVCSMLLALIVMDASQVTKDPKGLTVAQGYGKGKAPIGKGKGKGPPPPVVTKG
jgi:hypothetical protein